MDWGPGLGPAGCRNAEREDGEQGDTPGQTKCFVPNTAQSGQKDTNADKNDFLIIYKKSRGCDTVKGE